MPAPTATETAPSPRSITDQEKVALGIVSETARKQADALPQRSDWREALGYLAERLERTIG